MRLYGKPARRGSATNQGVDVVVNYTGGDTWVKSLRCLRVGGRLLTCGATNGYDPPEDLRFIWTFELKILGSNSWDREDLTQVLDLARSGALKAVVERRSDWKKCPRRCGGSRTVRYSERLW